MSHKILLGDCLQTLRTLEPYSVACCVTSPPYYGLRDYGTAQWEGGNPECDHTYQKGGRNPETSSKQLTSAGTTFSQYEKVCKRCGATRIDNQIGLEETPEQYVEKLVQVFREVRRVLKDDGTLWLNLGDSYARDSGNNNQAGANALVPNTRNGVTKRMSNLPNGYKAKDLLGIPWMVAFALRNDGVADYRAVRTIERVKAEILSEYENEPIPDKVINVLERLDAEYSEAKGDSWYLRSDVIWHKPNPMPESVTDRPTKSHEYLFLLTKSARYYYDHEAIAEPIARIWNENNIGPNNAKSTGAWDGKVLGRKENPHGGLTKTLPKNLQPDGQQPNSMHIARAHGEQDTQYAARNKRSVWTVSTKPYAGAHFATFPPDLIEPCILAGSRPGDWVLDPFFGSGTTGAVAIKHHRNVIGCELNPAYLPLINKRFAHIQPVLLGVG